MKFARVFLALALALTLSQAQLAQAAKKKSKSAAAAQTQVAVPVDATTTSNTQMQNMEQPNPLAGLSVRPIVGVSFMNPTALNSTVMDNFNNETGIKVGSAATFGVATDYAVWSRNVFVGLRFDAIKSSSSAISISANNAGTAQSSLSAYPLMATVSAMYPVVSKVSFGATVGAGYAFGYKFACDLSGSTDKANAPNGTLAYSATPVTGLGLAFANIDFTPHFALRIEGGYRLLSSNQLIATDKWGAKVREGDLLKDSNNSNLTVDGNSMFTGLSLSYTL
ncbi:hypothetical protein WDW86_07785 [Bdellovibrionota bacterium FG-2]